MRVVLHFKASTELENAFDWYEAKALTSAPASPYFAGVGDFALADGADLGGFQSHHCGGLPVQGGELHFIGQAIAVNVHHRAHVASFKSFGRHRHIQHDSFVFLKHKLPFI